MDGRTYENRLYLCGTKVSIHVDFKNNKIRE